MFFTYLLKIPYRVKQNKTKNLIPMSPFRKMCLSVKPDLIPAGHVPWSLCIDLPGERSVCT